MQEVLSYGKFLIVKDCFTYSFDFHKKDFFSESLLVYHSNLTLLFTNGVTYFLPR
jgi:hypothetical protein